MEGNRFDKYTGEPLDEEDDNIEDLPFRCKGMKKMTVTEEKKFPMIVAESIRCQSFHISRCERCNGCDFAISGCENVFEMSAG